MRARILIADDEPEILEIINKYLALEGYEVLTVLNGNEAMSLISRMEFDLILLDIAMPGEDGLSVCESVRGTVNCPIIFLTARVEEEDKVIGLSRGADDYITKPFGLAELGARVNAHLRREHRKGNPAARSSFGQLWIDFSSQQVGYKDKAIDLTRKEYRIVELLALHPGQVFSRERIFDIVWGYDSESDDSAVTEHIKRIRQKLNEYDRSGRIETLWGVGYKWKNI